MNRSVKTGATIAFAAASLLASACKKSDGQSPSTSTAAPAEQTAKVQCMGGNECKGKSGCKTANNGCAGQNECKGKGMVEMASAEECAAAGGTVQSN